MSNVITMKVCRVFFIMTVTIYLWDKITLKQQSPLLLHIYAWFF